MDVFAWKEDTIEQSRSLLGFGTIQMEEVLKKHYMQI
jgi:hypothetical protein